MTGPGPTYTPAELQQLWVDNGGSPATSAVAAAVALAESGGCRYALASAIDVRPVAECHYTVTGGENSHGLWQINVNPGAHPEYAGVDLFDPDLNARAAIAISQNGANWTAWSTYTDQAYLAFLPGADAATPPGISQQQAATVYTVTPRAAGNVSPPGTVHLPEAWALLTRALGADLAQANKRATATAARMRSVVAGSSKVQRGG